MSIVVDTPQGIRHFQLLSMRGRMHLELTTGMRFSNRTPKMSTVLRRQFGWKGNPEVLLKKLEDHIEQEYGPLGQRYA